MRLHVCLFCIPLFVLFTFPSFAIPGKGASDSTRTIDRSSPRAVHIPEISVPQSMHAMLPGNTRVRTVVQAEIDSTGRPGKMLVKWTTDARFNTLALEQAAKYRFEPYSSAKFTRSTVTIPMVFMRNPPRIIKNAW